MREANKLGAFLGTNVSQEMARQMAELVIPRERLPVEKRKMRSFLHGKLPRLIRKWSQ